MNSEPFPVPIEIINLPYSNLVLIRTLPDGSCFFHSVFRSFFPNYYYASDIKRAKFVKYLRNALAEDLTEIISEGKLYYDTLSNGQLRKLSKECPQLECSLEEMIDELNSDRFVANHYHEMTSDKLNKDIYIIDLNKQDLYLTGVIPNILYKNRDSIFIGYDENKQHFDLIGVRQGENIETLFSPEHEFTLMVKNRLKSMIK